MNRFSALLVGLSMFVVGCGGDSSPTVPSQGTTTTSTFTVPLSPANEVPAITNADASASGTATIALTVTKDDAGNITSASANFQISVTGFPAGTRVTDAHIHNAAAGSNGGAIVNVGLTSGELAITNGSGSITKNGINVPADRAAAILNNRAGHYFNVHTAINPDGAIRGQTVGGKLQSGHGGSVLGRTLDTTVTALCSLEDQGARTTGPPLVDPCMETLRLSALHRYRILDTEPERRFDDLAFLASHVCRTPMALITLVDEHRQWFKSRLGISITETSRAVSFCAHAIEQQDLFIIPDTLRDERFRENPLVTGDPHIRFYAGAPLATPDGHALGTLCVIDSRSRTLTADQRAALDALRRQVESQLELRRNLIELEEALSARDRAEAEQAAAMSELRAAHENVRRLSALIPLCSTCQFTMTIPADPAAIPILTDGLVEVLEEKCWPKEDVLAVQLALQEAVANAICHGCRGDVSQHVQCSVSCDESGEVVIVVRDPGSGFDPNAIADPLDSANILKPSGRGIFLINELMDHVQFADGGREVWMRKKKAPDLTPASR